MNAPLSKKLKSSKFIGLITIGWGLFYFGIYAVLLYFYPLTNQFEIIPIILIITLIMPIGSIFGGLYFLLKQRTLSRIVPNEIRNSVYSLIPTMQNIILAPLLIIFSLGIEAYSFVFAISIVSIMILPLGIIFTVNLKNI